MRWLVLPAMIVAFLGGAHLARSEAPQTVAKGLVQRQRALLKDLDKIQQAIRDTKEIRETRESGKYVLNSEERKLEKKARKDFHIFMERLRNNTLETLAIYDRLLGKQQYVDPLRRIFGKALDESVEIEWDDQDLEDIVDDLVVGYGVKMFVKGDIDIRRTMSLQGEMTLLSILLQIENVFDAKLVEKEGELWFIRIPRRPLGELGANEAEDDDEEACGED